MKRSLFFIFLLVSNSFLYAQTSTEINNTSESNSSQSSSEASNLGDDDFANAEDSVSQTDTQKDYLKTIEQQETLIFSGTFNASAIGIIGWQDPFILQGYLDTFDKSAGFSSEAVLIMNAKPDPLLDIYGSFSVAIPLGTYNWVAAIQSVYCNYKFLDVMYFKAGKFSQTFGQSRLFTPSNILLGTDAGLTLSAALPTILKGLTFGLYAQDSYFAVKGAISYYDMGVSAKADFVLGSVYFSNGYFYQTSAGHNGAVSIKTFLFGIDLLAEGSVKFTENILSWNALGGFFWENSNPKLKVYGEAKYSSNEKGNYTIDSALVCGLNNIFNTIWDAGIKWYHSYSDCSGNITLGITAKPFPLLTMNIGIPFIYGNENGYYVINNADIAKRKLALAFELKLSATF